MTKSATAVAAPAVAAPATDHWMKTEINAALDALRASGEGNAVDRRSAWNQARLRAGAAAFRAGNEKIAEGRYTVPVPVVSTDPVSGRLSEVIPVPGIRFLRAVALGCAIVPSGRLDRKALTA